MPGRESQIWPIPPARRQSEGVQTLFDRARAAAAAGGTVNLGTGGQDALYPYPTMPPIEPALDLERRSPAALRTYPGRQTWSNLIQGASPGVPLDWASILDLMVQEIIRHIDRGVSFSVQPFSAGVADAIVRPEEDRRYLFIQNNHAANNLFVGFGFAPTATFGVLIPAGGFYEPLWVPRNEIHLLGSAAATVGSIVYAT